MEVSEQEHKVGSKTDLEYLSTNQIITPDHSEAEAKAFDSDLMEDVPEYEDYVREKDEEFNFKRTHRHMEMFHRRVSKVGR